jgi:hypothetical protein
LSVQNIGLNDFPVALGFLRLMKKLLGLGGGGQGQTSQCTARHDPTELHKRIDGTGASNV